LAGIKNVGDVEDAAAIHANAGGVALGEWRRGGPMTAETGRVQYVFLDIVGFTRNRSVEAQSDLVDILNDVVKKAIDGLGLCEQDIVLLPTGDGMAIGLIEIRGVDVHLRLALEILRLVAERNAGETDAMRRFEVRMGINENIDNLVTDVNGKRNVAGNGISMAQRIMDKADGGQVLVGSTVYEVLRQREVYLSSFRRFPATGKHGVQFDVYQYVAKDAYGLNVDVPMAFMPTRSERPGLSKTAAYYMCHALAHREFLEDQKGDPVRDYVAVVLLASLARDSVEAAGTPPHDEPTTRTWGSGSASFRAQYQHYSEIDFWPLTDLGDLYKEKHLERYSECFESGVLPNYAFVSRRGIERLCAEWPEVCRTFAGDVPELAAAVEYKEEPGS
jgi:class 3 adenylate cyclase